MKSNAKNTPQLTFETQLQSVPVRNERVRITRPEDNAGALIVEVDLSYRGIVGLLSRLFHPRKSKKFQLEGLAREIYERIDGRRSLEQFIDDLMAGHKLTFFEARALIVQYLKILMERGLIVIAAP